MRGENECSISRITTPDWNSRDHAETGHSRRKGKIQEISRIRRDVAEEELAAGEILQKERSRGRRGRRTRELTEGDGEEEEEREKKM